MDAERAGRRLPRGSLIFAAAVCALPPSFLRHRTCLARRKSLPAPLGQLAELDCGHYVHDEAYTQTSAEILRFLREEVKQ